MVPEISIKSIVPFRYFS